MNIDELTRNTIESGGVLSFLYFDLHASKKDVLQQLATALVGKILDGKDVVYAMGEIDEPIEDKGMFSTFVEVKILVKNLASLVQLCANHCPFSVEILKPKEIKLCESDMHTILMNTSTNSNELKKLVLEKVYKEEDLEKFKKIIENRQKLGKKLLEKKG